MTIYLYIKQHSITGLKYFGRTESMNPFSYTGSGIYWRRHYKKYGKEHIVTLDVYGFDNQEDATYFALNFSKENNIIESSEWANLITENGKRISAKIQSQQEVNDKISKTLKRKYKSGEIVNHRNYGPLTENHKNKIKSTWKEKTNNPNYIHHNKGTEPWNKNRKNLQTAWNKGLKTGPNSKESNKKKSDTLKNYYKDKPGNRSGHAPWNKGLKNQQIAWNKGIKQETITCPHCSKIGSISNMKRWHFDNCKSLKLN